MSLWGKIIGGVAGFAVGGPFGAMLGAALGHAAESGGFARAMPTLGGPADPRAALQVAAMMGRREDVYALCVVALAAKVAKCDGAVSRAEIDAFKQVFRIPPEAVRDVGRLFDAARDGPEGVEPYADQLGHSFADMPGLLEAVLTALFMVARADGVINAAETATLQLVCVRLGLGQAAWDRARGARSAAPPRAEAADDPYAVLGLDPAAPTDQLRAAWLGLVRENHPDRLAGRGAAPDLIARAGERLARANAAWDRIKRERGL